MKPYRRRDTLTKNVSQSLFPFIVCNKGIQNNVLCVKTSNGHVSLSDRPLTKENNSHKNYCRWKQYKSGNRLVLLKPGYIDTCPRRTCTKKLAYWHVSSVNSGSKLSLFLANCRCFSQTVVVSRKVLRHTTNLGSGNTWRQPFRWRQKAPRAERL